jgi:serine/threonine-protein phosphatase 2A regulatory subunit A
VVRLRCPQLADRPLISFPGWNQDSLDDEDEVLLVIAEELGKFVEVVGGPAHAHLLLSPLESLATVDEASVRDMVRLKAVVMLSSMCWLTLCVLCALQAVRSICSVVEVMEGDHIVEHFVPVLRRLVTRDWCVCCSCPARFHSMRAA